MVRQPSPKIYGTAAERIVTIPTMPSDCLFCKIESGIIPAPRVAENDRAFAIRDINPRAPIHTLIIPKEHIPTAADLGAEHGETLAAMFTLATEVARHRRRDRQGLPAGVQRGRSSRDDHLAPPPAPARGAASSEPKDDTSPIRQQIDGRARGDDETRPPGLGLHTKRVLVESLDLAERWDVDPERVELATWGHDLFRAAKPMDTGSPWPGS